MKRFIIIFFFILFISFDSNLVTVTAQSQKFATNFYPLTNYRLMNVKVNPIILTQGIHKVSDINLPIDIPIKATIDSPNNKVIIIVINPNHEIQELIRLGAKTTNYNLKPLTHESSIIIFGTGAVSFSW